MEKKEPFKKVEDAATENLGGMLQRIFELKSSETNVSEKESEDLIKHIEETIFTPQLRIEMHRNGMTMRNPVVSLRRGRLSIGVQVHKGSKFAYATPHATRTIRLYYKPGERSELLIEDEDTITPLMNMNIPNTVGETAAIVRQFALNNLWPEENRAA